jgi:hypothetical protein
VQAATPPNYIRSRTQPKVIGVAKDDACVKLAFERFEANAFDCAGGADGHEHRSFNYAPAGSEQARASFTLARQYFESNWGLGNHSLDNLGFVDLGLGTVSFVL